MNNYYALIYLTRYLKNKCIGKTFQFSTSPHKNVWEASLDDEEEAARLIFSAAPDETALFMDGHRPAKQSNVTKFFNELTGRKIRDISLAENDRLLSVFFDSDVYLLFRLFGNQPNIFLVRDDTITESFKSSGDDTGKTPPRPRKPESPPRKLPEGLSPKQAVIKADPRFPRHLIPLIIQHYSLEDKPSAEILELIRTLTDAMIHNPEFRILESGNLCLIPEDLLPANTRKTFDNINSAVRYVYYHTSRERRLTHRLQSIQPGLEKSIRKTAAAIDQLSQADKGLQRAETYEQYGHILMAHAHSDFNEHTDRLTLPDFYNNNTPVEIPVKPGLSIAANARRYYDKSGKAVRQVEESKRRLAEMKKKLQKLQTIKQSLESIEKVFEFDDWYKTHKQELAELGILSGGKTPDSAPYKKMEINGYEIWIGKNAKSNDRLTSDAHKEDVWLHARGVAGSHVVIRMNNNREMPPRPVLLKAAALAAWHSKSRGSELVPVMITKRKYVSKPKGAPPGAVRVHREEVEMVKPAKKIS